MATLLPQPPPPRLFAEYATGAFDGVLRLRQPRVERDHQLENRRAKYPATGQFRRRFHTQEDWQAWLRWSTAARGPSTPRAAAVATRPGLGRVPLSRGDRMLVAVRSFVYTDCYGCHEMTAGESYVAPLHPAALLYPDSFRPSSRPYGVRTSAVR
jgi:hypothetical protein